MNWAYWVKLATGCVTSMLVVQALQAYAVGVFVGVNGIDWTPERPGDGVLDLWFNFWARVGIRRGANAK